MGLAQRASLSLESPRHVAKGGASWQEDPAKIRLAQALLCLEGSRRHEAGFGSVERHSPCAGEPKLQLHVFVERFAPNASGRLSRWVCKASSVVERRWRYC